jgi:hypothetical protein
VSEKTYEVIFGNICSALPKHDAWWCACNVLLAGTSVWECQFTIDRGSLRKWQFSMSDESVVASILTTCGLDILTKKLEGGIPKSFENIRISSENYLKPQSLKQAQSEPHLITIRTKIGF